MLGHPSFRAGRFPGFLEILKSLSAMPAIQLRLDSKKLL
jgi:hypothetical protein